jgi:hypothetical protein
LRFIALLILLTASGCDGSHAKPYGAVQDAGLSADGKTLLVLVEHGTKTTATSNNLWRGDISTEQPDTEQIHEFDRGSGKPGRVLSYPAPPVTGPRGHESLAVYAAKAGVPAVPLKECREFYTECAETTSPKPYMINGQVIDPQAGKLIEWDGRQLVVAPFEAMNAAQIRAAREALFRRSVERMRTAAAKDFATRAAAENPERITTGEVGTAERDPGMTASYSFFPGRITRARFQYAESRFFVVWQRDGACVTDSATVAALVAGCRASDEDGLRRAIEGIALSRAPDPDRTGTSWGVIATTDSPETPLGTTTVACRGLPREPADSPCNDPKGSTACRATLPLLCSKADASRAAPSPFARQLALTAPVRGTELVSVGVADQVCRVQLGEGWKMTEVHESKFLYQITGVGRLAATSRFWVRNGEGLANCW